MYNILIVDDEELICRGLKSMIERSKIIGVGEVYYTYEPLKAEALVDENSIKIIITDIMMPDLNGIDLIQNVLKEHPGIKVSVLSGYDDFIYVKDAFKLGAIDYILKPGTIEELKAVIGKMIASLDKEQEVKKEQKDKASMYVEAVMENKLNKLLMGVELDESTLEAHLNEMNISFSYSYFKVGIISYNKTKAENHIEEIKKELDVVHSALLKENRTSIMYFYDLMGNIIFIFNHSEEIEDVVIAQLGKLLKNLEKNVEIESYGSISNTGKGLQSIIPCYNQARQLIRYKILGDYGTLMNADLLKNKTVPSSKVDNKIGLLREYVMSHKSSEVSDVIDILFNKEEMKDWTIDSISCLYKKIIHKATSKDNYLDFDSFNTINDIKIYLKMLVFETIKELKDKSVDKSVSDVAKKYVSENYYKDIDMAVVSNMVSLSYSHFSKLFKDETGMNFSDYLLKVRMEKAMELLSNPVNKVNDISQKVGYGNPKHFTRAFKNYFGVSPSEYRNN